MRKGTIKKIITAAVVAMVVSTFFFGGFGGLKTAVTNLITPPAATEQPAE